jgi:lipid-binding SYLF domain-containing protein
MAYSASAPPMLVAQGIGGYGKIWMYVTAADAAGTIDGADFIANGAALGLGVSDSFIVVDTATPLTTFHRVESVTAGGAADIALGTTVGSATTGD